MELSEIYKNIEIIEKGISWGNTYLPEAEKQEFLRKMIECRCGMRRIHYAMSEQCAAATFGESQMGKSYLVNALFSDPNSPFKVVNLGREYRFATEINPSRSTSTIEATGVVTRFTPRPAADVPDGFVRAQLLSVADIIIILSEAFLSETNFEPKSALDWVEYIACAIKETKLGGSQNWLIEDDILNVESYFESHLAKKCGPLLEDRIGFFPFIMRNLHNLSEDELFGLIKKIWYDNDNISGLFDDLMAFYRNLRKSADVYVEFSALLKKHGSILDVSRLDEMYNPTPKDEATEYTPKVNIKFNKADSGSIEIKKSFLSAWIAELSIPVKLEKTNCDRDFFEELDILDFPGACPDESISVANLGIGDNRSMVFRRGKIAYLFNKYSSARRISSLLFCHNQNMPKFGKMADYLTNWVEQNIGNTPEARMGMIAETNGISPLFILSTWFNKDLQEAEGEDDVADLISRWNRRFDTVLNSYLLKAGDPKNSSHWFHNWSGRGQFNNIYPLRDFRFSKEVFTGYKPAENLPESGYVNKEFCDRLRDTFVNHEFVNSHFANPSQSWEDAATPTNDGTKPIMAALNKMAPAIKKARENHFDSEAKTLMKIVMDCFYEKFHSGDSSSEIKKARKLAGRIILSMDSECGKDSYFFIKLQDRMMVQESNLYEMVFTQLNGQQNELSMTSQESQIYMNACLNTKANRAENLSRLMDYLCADDEDECRELLLQQGVNLDDLLGKNQMLQSPAECLVTLVEKYWYNDFLLGECVNSFKETLPLIGDICEKLYATYTHLQVHQKLVDKVDHYMKVLSVDNATGIIADYLAMELNHFTNSFGFDYYDKSQKTTLEKQTEEHKLGIDWSILNFSDDPKGVVLLTEKAKALEALTKLGYGAEAHAQQMLLPQFRNMWLWQQELRVALALVCHIPNYDIVANEQLGKIIESL